MSDYNFEQEDSTQASFYDEESHGINSKKGGCEDGCGHDHGGGQSHGKKGHKRRSQGFKKFLKEKNTLLKILYFIYQSSNVGIMMNWHLRGFEDKFYIWAMWWIMAIGGAMMLATHVVAGNTKVTKFDRQKQRGFFGEEYNECDRCKVSKWKPERMRHCSITGDCIVRFDHYCPALLSPVGYRNHGTFIVTAFLHMAMIIVFLVTGTDYLFTKFFTDIWEYNGFIIAVVLIAGFFNCILLFTIGVMSIGIFFSHFTFAMFNSTTIEGMSSGEGVGAFDKFEGSYNLGILYNLKNYFAQPYLFFWWPNAKDSKYEGYWFPSVGVPREEIKCVSKISNKCRVNGCDIAIESNSKFIEVSKMMYGDHTFIFHNQILNPDGSIKNTKPPIFRNSRRQRTQEITEKIPEEEDQEREEIDQLETEDRLIKD